MVLIIAIIYSIQINHLFVHSEVVTSTVINTDYSVQHSEMVPSYSSAEMQSVYSTNPTDWSRTQMIPSIGRYC